MNLQKEIDEILEQFEREFDRCSGNYKYNRKPIVRQLIFICKKYALSCLPEELEIPDNAENNVGVSLFKFFNQAIKQAKDKINE